MDERIPFEVQFSKQAQKDISLLTPKQKEKLQRLIDQVLSVNPYLRKSLKGDLKGLHSYRLNQVDRVVCEIIEEDKVILIIRTRSHYGD